ncbi:MAG: DUF2202 domain-containing protein [Cyclobacteriaceae bacterium]
MKKLLRVLSLVTLVFTFLATSCSEEDTLPLSDENSNINVRSLQEQLNDLPMETLSSDEQSSLMFMREEEKLARDVYVVLFDEWGVNIFSNISKSEQTHMDAMLLLLTKYSVTDPVGTNPVGVFSNSVLQDLYDQLVTQGKISLLDAYQVGATIEDVDIFDLTHALSETDNEDITLVYEMLSKGSRNHLRSFYGNILNVDGSYTPQYITQEEFDAIVTSPKETGF